MKKPLKNIAASVRDRLSAIQRQSGRDYQGLMVQYALERLLYRLSVSAYRDRFLLKGAMLFTIWQGAPHRMTRDLDLLGFGDPSIASLEAIFRELCTLVIDDDGLTLDAATVKGSEIRAEALYVGVRLILLAHIGSAKFPLQIDVDFGDDFLGIPEEVTMPSLLDMPEAHLRAYRRETVISEKLEAVVTLGLQNSRLKDYFDFWFLGHRFAFEGDVLASSITGTFSRRGTRLPSTLPRGLSAEYSSDPARVAAWDAFWRKAGSREENPSLAIVVQFVAIFLGPPISAANRGEQFKESWRPGGPWRESDKQ